MKNQREKTKGKIVRAVVSYRIKGDVEECLTKIRSCGSRVRAIGCSVDHGHYSVDQIGDIEILDGDKQTTGEFQRWASKMAKMYLANAIEHRDARNKEHSQRVRLLRSEFMKRWAQDYAATVRDWRLNPRNGDVK